MAAAQRGCLKAAPTARELRPDDHAALVGKQVDFCLMDEGHASIGTIPVSRVTAWPDSDEAKQAIRTLSPSEPVPQDGSRVSTTSYTILVVDGVGYRARVLEFSS